MTYLEKLVKLLVEDIINGKDSTVYDFEDFLRECVYTEVWYVIKTPKDAYNCLEEMDWLFGWDDVLEYDDLQTVTSLIDVAGFALRRYVMENYAYIKELANLEYLFN